MRKKKQFRLYDVYRKVVTNEESDIYGIREYDASKFDNIPFIKVKVVFHSYEEWEDTFSTTIDGEVKLKLFIKRVNKQLKNCRKPGPKPKN